MNHGGKREGAGRKPLPAGEKKVPLAIKVKPRLREYLKQTDNQSKTIEEALERSKAFREWRAKTR